MVSFHIQLIVILFSCISCDSNLNQFEENQFEEDTYQYDVDDNTINDNNVLNRGYTIVVNEFEIKDFKILKEQNVNLVRCMLYRTYTLKNRQDLKFYQLWLDKELNKLDTLLEEAKKYNIKIIIDLHTLPGELLDDGSNRLFYEQQYADYFIKVWKQIANRYKENTMLYGFELFNEPVEMNSNMKALYNCIEIQSLAARAIREIDFVTPIIFSSNLWNAPEPFFEVPITEFDNIIYSVHFYQDMLYTHQGIDGFSKDTYKYPGVIGLWNFDKNTMIKTLKKVRQFQIDNDVKIYVGEFSVVRWAEGGDKWLEDAISIFENYGWDWTYHAWCNYHNNTNVSTLWSLEAENGSWGSYNTVLSEINTDRKKVVLNTFKKN